MCGGDRLALRIAAAEVRRAIVAVDRKSDVEVQQAVGILNPDILDEQVLDFRPVAVVDGERAAADHMDDVTVAEGDSADGVDAEFEADFETLAAGIVPEHAVGDGDVADDVALDAGDLMTAECFRVDHFIEGDALGIRRIDRFDGDAIVIGAPEAAVHADLAGILDIESIAIGAPADDSGVGDSDVLRSADVHRPAERIEQDNVLDYRVAALA